MRNSVLLAEESYAAADRVDGAVAATGHQTSVIGDHAPNQHRIGRPPTTEQLASARRMQEIMSDMEAELKEQVEKLVAERH
ncbi:hypothetical protein JQ633_24675 [Bradyrhizobium tropiciagri]|uniref:hypothetical protein n=1 Tax=Bradyrhizobium tropiciagri TaxID=312253 RepID=UPI001BA732F0|nr:hypothetical protein [Bradyrhizobium tropiciagri]MBR0873574.1 hypothetical protein [Bradyrhizobium tropiciagri]